MMTDVTKAILKINPNASFTVENNDVNQITWLNDTTPISASDIENEFDSVNNDISMEQLRTERNAKLAETDWEIVMHKEKGTNIPAALKTYRQSLRDITNDYTSLDDVVWPEKP
jgi:hypothetical protein